MVKLLEKFRTSKESRNPHEGKFIICPSSQSLFIDIDGNLIKPVADIISKRDFNCTQDRYSMVLPGLSEWYERFLQSSEEGFCWQDWHHDGLLFAKEIYLNMPRNIQVRYVVPQEDHSGLIEDFDVTEDKIDSYLVSLGESSEDRLPAYEDVVAVGVKDEDGAMVIRLKIKGLMDTFTFQMDYGLVSDFKSFLERIALSDGEVALWESKTTDNGMYFFPQTIGGLRDMGRFLIYIEGGSKPEFSAYINARSFVRSIYRTIRTNAHNLSYEGVYDEIYSDIIEWYIDDETYSRHPFFRKNPKLVTWLTPAIVKTRKFFQEIYEGVIDDEVV